MSILNAPAHVNFALGESVPHHFKAFTNYLNQQTKLHADKVYIRYYDDCGGGGGVGGVVKTLTYSDVDRLAINLACKLAKQHNIGRLGNMEEVVCFIGDHSVGCVIVLLAVLKLRVPLLVISPRNSEAAVVNLLEKTGSKWLIVAGSKYQAFAKAAVSNVPAGGVGLVALPPFDFEALAKDKMDPTHRQILNLDFSDQDLSKTALILHSSGTTAFPKPVRFSNRYLFHAISSIEILVNSNDKLDSLTDKDVCLPIAPLFHVMGLSVFFSGTAFGGSVVLLGKLPASQEAIFDALVANNVTFCVAPPLIYEQMAAHVKQTKDLTAVELLALQRLKYALTGGALLGSDLLAWFHTNNINVCAFYGSTENNTVMASDFDRKSKNCNSLKLFRKDSHGVPYGTFEINDINEPHIKHLYLGADSPFLGTCVANRDDGGYSTQDLFVENPDYPGYYNYLGRRDDTLVMENGEKTNPVPMEIAMRQSPMIEQAAVIGHGRQCTAVLIQLNKDATKECSLKEAHIAVHTAVTRANIECPNHSKIFPEMVKILSLNEVLPCTDKGTVLRKKAESIFQDAVEKLYRDFLEGGSTRLDDNTLSACCWSPEKTEDFLIDCAAQVLGIPRSIIQDGPPSRSLFDHGLNSINAIQLRNLIAKHFKDVTPNFLFQHGSIQSMQKALMARRKEDAKTAEQMMEERYQQTQKLSEHYTQRAQVDFPRRAINQYDTTAASGNKGNVVLLTGVTGSLGSFILRQLLQDATVKKVYCCVRGEDHQLRDRLIEALTLRSLDASLLDTDRVEILPMRFSEPLLGFSAERYTQLKQDVTIVQHCAWLLNFNMPIDYFDKECIQPFYNLLKFAYKEVNPMHVHFISSVSASAAAGGDEIAEAPLPLDSHVAMPMGYAQSKFVVEVLFNYLTVEKNFPCYIQRLGQVCGDSVNGVWNVSEQYPLMFIGGGSVMRKMPRLDIAIDWIAIDHAAACITDIMLRTACLAANAEQSIYHIVNPHRIRWSDILVSIKEAGMTFDTVEPSTWVQDLAQDDTNPAFRLLPFYQDNFKKPFKMSVWRTEKTCAFTPILSKSPVLDTKLFTKFLTHWKTVGFYKPTI